MTSPVQSAKHPFAVTIDGPAASGKSSTARMVAEQIGARHVDSGALYRAVTAARLREGDDATLWTEGSVLHAAQRVSFRPGTTTFLANIDGEDCEDEIRGDAVTALVSLVAKMNHVRLWVNEQVRALSEAHDVVADGRDMGTVVFPDAGLKIWLVALPTERARRRLLQRGGGEPTAEALEAETDALETRDLRDSEQTQPAPDAVWVDTTGITQTEQVARIVALAAERRA